MFTTARKPLTAALAALTLGAATLAPIHQAQAFPPGGFAHHGHAHHHFRHHRGGGFGGGAMAGLAIGLGMAVIGSAIAAQQQAQAARAESYALTPEPLGEAARRMGRPRLAPVHARATSVDPDTGNRITVIGRRDGSREVIEVGPNGRLVDRRIKRPPLARPPKPRRVFLYERVDPQSGRMTAFYDNLDGTASSETRSRTGEVIGTANFNGKSADRVIAQRR
jgi:hypothetical protein